MKAFPSTPQELDATLADIKRQGAPQADINAFIDEYRRRKGDTGMAQGDMSKPSSGAVLFPVNPEKETYLSNTLKTLGNLIPSALNFGKNVLKSTFVDMPLEAIKQGEKAFSDPGVPGGSVGDAILGTLKNVPKTAYDLFVPEGAKKLFSGDLQGAQKLIAEDPVGQVAPFVLGAKGAADALGKGAVVDSAISKAAAPVADPLRAVGEQAGNVARSGASAFTKLDTETIRQIMNDPEQLQHFIKQGTDRYSIAEDVQGALQKKLAGMDEQIAGFTPRNFAEEIKNSLDQRIAELNDTGKGYEPFRSNGGLDNPLVKVEPTFLEDLLKNKAGVTIEDGKVKANPNGKIFDAKDARALQDLYDSWNKVFQTEGMTTNEFLNFRTKLADLSKFERDIGKSGPLESFAKEARKTLNNEYRDQIKGLSEKDAEFSKQSAELSDLRKGLIDSEGNLNESAISKIANAPKNDLFAQRLERIVPGITARIRFMGDILESKRELSKNILDKDGNLTDAAVNRIASAGKNDIFAKRLEEIAPGITDRIKVLKAVEDIKNASVNKITLGGTAALTYFVNPYFIVATILSIPKIAIPLLRGIGMSMDQIGRVTGNLNIPPAMLADPKDKASQDNKALRPLRPVPQP